MERNIDGQVNVNW